VIKRRSRTAAGEQKRLRTKAAQHKRPDGNVAQGIEIETNGGRQKQEGGDTKAIDLLTT
jgi:hypothetical protein